MSEYFIFSNSFAAPCLSESDTGFVEAESPEDALKKFAATYTHPAGLYAAVCYASAEAYHKKAAPLAKWLCNRELEKMRLTKDLGGYSLMGNGPGNFEIDGKSYTVIDPKNGRVVAAESIPADAGPRK